MTAPNMATMTASLERSLQNCSLNGSSNGANNGGFGRSASSDDSPENLNTITSSDNSSTLELNSETALPYHWEQCLDLKTGEIYYVNWRSGSRTKEDPRKSSSVRFESDNQYYFSDEEDSSYDSEGSSSASSPSDLNYTTTNGADQVLVVAGCKSCMMYFMLPKRVEECPKCNAFLLHIDGSAHKSP